MRVNILNNLKRRGGGLKFVNSLACLSLAATFPFLASCSKETSEEDFNSESLSDTRTAADSTAASGLHLMADTAWADTLRISYDNPALDATTAVPGGDAAMAASRRERK
jgi:hypothetical protein